jgi:hypothetical protein
MKRKCIPADIRTRLINGVKKRVAQGKSPQATHTWSVSEQPKGESNASHTRKLTRRGASNLFATRHGYRSPTYTHAHLLYPFPQFPFLWQAFVRLSP